ncbi:hypothetical protein I9P37_06925 [Brucella abortus]|nr:hypothetical protein [Brucella abortus]
MFSESARLGGPTTTVSDIATADYPTEAARPMNLRLSAVKLRAASLKKSRHKFCEMVRFSGGLLFASALIFLLYVPQRER